MENKLDITCVELALEYLDSFLEIESQRLHYNESTGESTLTQVDFTEAWIALDYLKEALHGEK